MTKKASWSKQNWSDARQTKDPTKTICRCYMLYKQMVLCAICRRIDKYPTLDHIIPRDVKAVVMICWTFRFTNISAPDGDFSVKYLFPDWGVYQVISRIHSKDVSALASFKVLVPVQPVGIINTNYLMPLLLPAGLVGIIGTIFTVAFLIIFKWRMKIGWIRIFNHKR